MTQIIMAKELCKFYQEEDRSVKKAVQKVSFAVNRGEIFSLLGPNGAGKTTMIKILLGLIEPTSGEIWVDGEKVAGNRLTLRKKLGYLPERVALYPNLTARETLSFFARLRGLDEKHATEVLTKVGLANVLDRPTGKFSKGMLQRLGLAQAILGSPDLLILDEPTSGLDPEGAIKFKQLIKQLNADGITIIFTSHILSEVQDLADQIGIMKDGQLIAWGEVSELGVSLGLLPKLSVRLSKPVDGHFLEMVEQAGGRLATGRDNLIKFSCQGKDKLKVLQMLAAAGMEIVDFYSREPTLENVFFQYLAQAKGSHSHE